MILLSEGCNLLFVVFFSIAEETTTRASATRDEGQRPSREWPTKLKIILDRHRPFLPKWKMAFVISCVFAVLLDPLFFYIPIVKNDMKCIGLDKRLEAIVISLRSATDLFYIVDITIQIYIEPKVPTYRVMGRSYLHTMILTKGMILVEDALAMAKLIWRVSSHILIDFLAVLPIPQVKSLSGVKKLLYQSLFLKHATQEKEAVDQI